MTKAPSSPLTDDDLHFFNEGTHTSLGEVMGARLGVMDGVAGVHFSVWAPGANHVSVVGDWNGWSRGADALAPVGRSGIWHGFIRAWPGERSTSSTSAHRRASPSTRPIPTRSSPSDARRRHPSSGTCDYAWSDGDWMADRGERNALEAPDLRLRGPPRLLEARPDEGNRQLTYRELAPRLVEHCRTMGFTHVELLPVMEHPFDASWGYQTPATSLRPAASARRRSSCAWSTRCTSAGIGVILDWVPVALPERRARPRLLRRHPPLRARRSAPGRSTRTGAALIFNYGRDEVRNFLIATRCTGCEQYHVDGLRVDAVASMLYLDYSRKEGEWIPNRYGGRENLEAIALPAAAERRASMASYPDVQTIAEESTAWPAVSRARPTSAASASAKWDMGWMHDTLHYLQRDPIYRALPPRPS